MYTEDMRERKTGMTKTVVYRGYEIERWVVGYAYARNGNLHNPTPRVEWLVDKVPSRSLRAAKALVDLMIDMKETQT